ncbi:uncharacterized protein si:ch211-244b2.3 isoform X1 [Plectropomus leopardus]|uniref:uncharacterized protein si:ch211-244b2.3 isoform X1 n=1 Tax=Plectropomus leopardus TaxID=160734 RepID=UPI001C4C06B4|nr:uncharacterized protein si:ch211-244b2.3 isoform X1 [Plectropomus leopardus]
MDTEESMRFCPETPVKRKHYEWQLSNGHQWQPIENDHVIETHYCQPGAKGITLNFNQWKVYIDFDKLETLTAGLKVQRISFLLPGQTEDVGWYFRDDQLWCEYGSQSSSTVSSSISSGDIEHQFHQNPRGTFSFTVGSTAYTLNFSTMTQTNCVTGLQRNVRRRPKFTSNTERSTKQCQLVVPRLRKKNRRDRTFAVLSRRLWNSLPSGDSAVFPAASSSQLTDGGYKWEFMGEEEQWTEYKAHICSFDSAAIERQYQLNPQGQLHFRIKRYSYTLDFSRMCQVNDNIGTTRAVRRTADDGSQQISSSGTQPRWQFQDINGRWKDYSKMSSSVSSQDIELQYQQNPSGIVTFTTMHFSYELNFSAMTQRNLSTNTTRSVRRLNQ